MPLDNNDQAAGDIAQQPQTGTDSAAALDNTGTSQPGETTGPVSDAVQAIDPNAETIPPAVIDVIAPMGGFDANGLPVFTPEQVQAAFSASGSVVEEWNTLSNADRTGVIQAFLASQPGTIEHAIAAAGAGANVSVTDTGVVLSDTPGTTNLGGDAPIAALGNIAMDDTPASETTEPGSIPAVGAPVMNTPAPEQAVSTDAPAVTSADSGVATGVTVTDTSNTDPDSTSVMGDTELDRILAKVPYPHRAPILEMMEYMAAMHPSRNMSVNDGVRQQMSLFRGLQNIINRNEQFFRPFFTAVLYLYYKHRNDTTAPQNINRHHEHIKFEKHDIKALQRINNLLMVLADPASRKAATSQIDFEKSMQYGFTNEGRQLVKDYFSVQ